MYVRFVVDEMDDVSEKRKGIVQAIYEKLEEDAFEAEIETRVRELIAWMDKNLKEPYRFSRAKNNQYGYAGRGLSWFKDTAWRHIEVFREFSTLLDLYGVPSRMITTQRAGYIVYEDDHQVVAEPFADTPT